MSMLSVARLAMPWNVVVAILAVVAFSAICWALVERVKRVSGQKIGSTTNASEIVQQLTAERKARVAAEDEADKQRTRADGFFGMLERIDHQCQLAWRLYEEQAIRNANAQGWLFRELRRHALRSKLEIDPKLVRVVDDYSADHPKKKPDPEKAVAALQQLGAGQVQAALGLLETSRGVAPEPLKELSTK